ncbi:MAG: NAD(P)-dependent oxidoreductase, partial [Ruminococcus sp.]|nr:NAD(P)-dependent oxidoreductase [Ruminococcus sp.]
MNLAVVTGGCGLIGQHICSGLLKKGFAVIAVDREPGIYNEGKLNYSFVQADPTDKDAYAEIFENNEVAVLIHAACTVDNDIGPIVTEKEVNEAKQCDKFMYRYAMGENVKKIV